MKRTTSSPTTLAARTRSAYLQRAANIVGICDRAGRPDLAAGFIRQGISEALVKHKIAQLHAASWQRLHQAAAKQPSGSFIIKGQP